MIWREEFEIGIESIDEQHKELFVRYNDLLKCIKKSNDDNEILASVEETLDFLSEYIIYHFNSEERYQQKINYPRIDEHKKIHQSFKETVLDFKREILKNPDFDELIMAFSGYLSAWLINHVCDEDQKIYYFVNKESIDELDEILEKPLDIIKGSIDDVILMMSRISVCEVETFKLSDIDTLSISIKITGEYEKRLLFQFSTKFIKALLKGMLNLDKVEIDTFATSALKEIVNTIIGHITNNMQTIGLECDFEASELSSFQAPESAEAVYFESEHGKFRLLLT